MGCEKGSMAMGCDIHLIPEMKWSAGPSEWHPVTHWEWASGEYQATELSVARDYDVFRRLVSGVREDGITQAIGDARGLPSDVHKVTKSAFMNSDYHHVSWMHQNEFEMHFPWRGTRSEMSHFAIVCYSAMQWEYAEYRFIFEFDN